MIKIPGKTKKHSVPNNSDLFGTIYYGKNINLDEEGYVKLSSRVVSIFNEKDTGNLALPAAFGRKSVFNNSIDYAITQTDHKGYWLTLVDTGNTLNVDIGTDAPNLNEGSNAVWYQNLWTVTSDTDWWTKENVTDVANYTNRGTLTGGNVHPIEVFRNRNTICIGDGNLVRQFDSTYSSTTDLTLPTDFEVIGLAYSNTKMGIIAMLSDTAQGQNQEAYFFTWDGATGEANQGIPIGSDKPIALTSYKGSWVILTRDGQLRFFTGGGWQELTALPFYYKVIVWGTPYTRDLLGNVMMVDGDLIYLNINNLFNSFGSKYETYLPNNIGGIVVYDPEVGIYNRYTPSISPVSTLLVTSGNVNTGTDVMTKTAGTIPSTGSPIKYISDKSNQIGGLTTPTIYYCIKLSATTFSLATTKSNALLGVAINLTSTGASNNYFWALELYDYGQNYASRTGAIAQLGESTPTHDQLIFGVELNDFSSTNNYVHLNLTVPDFENRGYFATSKVTSDAVMDNRSKLYIKYRPLRDTDKIILKIKEKEIAGLPITTPQARTSAVNQCTWNSANSLQTTADLSDALSAFNLGVELECEVIAGAGAGGMTKITDLSFGGGTYAVQLQEDIDGAAAARLCDIIIENWRKMGEVTSADIDGYKQFTMGSKSVSAKFKVELRGVNTTVEELQIINDTDKPSK